MAAEDYDDVPGFGGGAWIPSGRPSQMACKFCEAKISFRSRKPFNMDGTPHRCKGRAPDAGDPEPPPQATLFAMAAMNAIVSAQIQKGGVDFIHHMNFYDVADASWRLSAAMTNAEKQHRHEFDRTEAKP